MLPAFTWRQRNGSSFRQEGAEPVAAQGELFLGDARRLGGVAVVRLDGGDSVIVAVSIEATGKPCAEELDERESYPL
jgi:hypothetical protein